MQWSAVKTKLLAGSAALRRRVNLRLISKLAIATAALGFLLISIEAIIRARIEPPLARMPTALYTRAEPWGGGDRRPPVAIGGLAGMPDERRIPVSIADVPDRMTEAVLAVEDQRFYRHHGLDFKRIGGALVANIRAGEVSQGGSTITQQLAKNLFLSAERSPLRKLREAAMALVLEARYDKATILEAYLNEVYFGQDGPRPIHGIGAAARFYFGRDVGDLGLSEAALLAGMIQAPNHYSPIRHDRAARQRRNLVLALMVAQERISRKSADQAGRVRIAARSWPAPTLDARYFRDLVMAAPQAKLPARGGAIYTTLDPSLQRAAERAVRGGLDGFRARDAQAALVAIDPRTGDILALVGGRDYGASQFNRAVDARRQPGSAFKPLVALAAFHREGDQAPAFTLASRIDDAPLRVETRAGPWEPANYDGTFRGEVTVRQAIEQSLNVPFARIGLAIGPARIIATARRLGIASPLKAVPSLALGSSEVSLLELVRAYGVFATGGELAATRAVLGRSTTGSEMVTGGQPQVARVADPAEVYLVTSALQGVIERGTGRALEAGGRFGAIAGKTGTSNDWRDAWFVAYSPSLVVGVWVGYDDGRSLGMSGAQAALPIVARFLNGSEPDEPSASFPVPDGIETARIGSGWSDCDAEEIFLAGTAPANECDGLDRERIEQPDDDDREIPRALERSGRSTVRWLERLLERAIQERRRRNH